MSYGLYFFLKKKIQKKSEGFVFLFRQFVRYPYEK
jgi:hypothetical protein